MKTEPTDPIEKARYHLEERKHGTNLRDRLADVLEKYDELVLERNALERKLHFVTKANASPQTVEADRNNWQRRLGVLLTLIETWGDGELVERAYRIVNTNPRSGSIEDPYADIARLVVRQTLEAALEAGVVDPGPKAPHWMLWNDEEE